MNNIDQKYNHLTLYIITFVLAACSLLYELILAQTLSSLADNTVVWYSLTLGVYLLAMGIGAFYCPRVESIKKGIEALINVEWKLCLVGSLSVVLIHFAHMLYGHVWFKTLYLPLMQQFGGLVIAMIIFVSVAFATIFAIGFLTGQELPLLIHLGKIDSTTNKTHRILTADYFGSLLAGLIFPLVLIPNFSLLQMAVFAAIVNFLVIVYVRTKVSVTGVKTYKLRFACLALLFIFLSLFHQNIQQYFLQRFYYFQTFQNLKDLFFAQSNLPKVERFKSIYQNIDLVTHLRKDQNISTLLYKSYSQKHKLMPDYPRHLKLYLNGDIQFLSDFEEAYHEYFAHIPIILNDHVPERVLVLGGGDGLLIRELVKYDQLREIVHVELDPAMINLVKNHASLATLSQNALNDPRVKSITGDAFNFLKVNNETFDAIYMDFPDPLNYNLSKLYSYEFYHFVKKALGKKGFAVFDATGIRKIVTHNNEINSHNPWMVYFNTLKAVGFPTIVPYVTNLEVDNPIAKVALIGMMDENFSIVERKFEKQGNFYESKFQRYTAKEDPEEVADIIIENFFRGIEEGFIFVKANKVEPHTQYIDPGFPLFILNEKRFNLALTIADQLPQDLDPSEINSIMRPTLPKSSFFSWVKLPN